VQARRRRTQSADLLLRDQRATLREAQTRLRAAAHEDPLTGLSNRRRMDEDIAVMEARLTRRTFGLAAVMVDLDAFKAYNDSLGHPAGDKVLSACASAIRKASRRGDRVYRYGGEEILVLLEDGSRELALAAAQRMVSAVRDLRIPHPGASVGVITVSAGSAASQGRAIGPWAVIDEADRALYASKAAGGDRALAYGSPHAQTARASETLTELVLPPLGSQQNSVVSLAVSARGAGGR
jgi:diguanylate cyclase (GGDEF)-like protein